MERVFKYLPNCQIYSIVFIFLMTRISLGFSVPIFHNHLCVLGTSAGKKYEKNTLKSYFSLIFWL